MNDHQKNWEIFFLIPNLRINNPFDNDTMAIVPYNDPRVEEICSSNKWAEYLVDNFEDQFKRKQYPSLFLIRKKNSPSVLGIDDDFENFRGQTYPGLDSLHAVAEPDEQILFLLEKAWKKRFVNSRLRDWHTTALFRSLEMSYQAATMPFKNHSTIYEYGASDGNPVKMSRLFPFQNRKNQPVTFFAPLIYKIALLCFLNQVVPAEKIDPLKEYMSKKINESPLAKAILRANRGGGNG